LSTSNVHTGAAASIAEHPIGLLKQLRFRVTVNTDNRLMSDISPSRELAGLVDTFDTTGTTWRADRERHEERILAVRPPAADHQRDHKPASRP